jgi:hypothetical protein
MRESSVSKTESFILSAVFVFYFPYVNSAQHSTYQRVQPKVASRRLLVMKSHYLMDVSLRLIYF